MLETGLKRRSLGFEVTRIITKGSTPRRESGLFNAFIMFL